MKRIGIVAVVVVALVAATLTGIWLGTRNGTTTATATTASSTTRIPTTSRAGGVSAGTVAAGGGGSLPGPGALKLGYAHTPDGAVAAITSYMLAATDQARIADDGYRSALASAIALDEPSRADITKGLVLSAKFCAGFATCDWGPRRGAYAIRSYSDTQAEVAVWAPHTYANPRDGSGRESITWGIGTYMVFWNGTDWRLRSLSGDGALEDASNPVQGPANPKGNPTSAEKATILTAPRDGNVKLWTLTWMEYSNALH